MQSFLQENKKHLSQEKEYETDVNLTSTLLRKQYHFNSVEEAISSNGYTTIKNGIDQLFELVSENGIAANQNAIQLLIDRILLKKTEAFIYVLSATYNFISKHQWDDVKFLEDKILLVLGLYQGEACVELNVPVPTAYHYFVKIALLLKKYGKNPDDDDIKYWLDQIKTKRYNTLLDIDLKGV